MSKLWNKIKAWWGGLFGTSTSTSTSTADPLPASQTGLVNSGGVGTPLPALLEETAPTVAPAMPGLQTYANLPAVHRPVPAQRNMKAEIIRARTGGVLTTFSDIAPNDASLPADAARLAWLYGPLDQFQALPWDVMAAAWGDPYNGPDADRLEEANRTNAELLAANAAVWHQWLLNLGAPPEGWRNTAAIPAAFGG